MNMLVAMAIAAACCILIGVYPRLLYNLLPYKADFIPYTLEHVATQLQLLLFAVLAFTVMMRTHLHPPELPATILDFDWFYRKPGRKIALAAGHLAERAWYVATSALQAVARKAVDGLERHYGRAGVLGRAWQTGNMDDDARRLPCPIVSLIAERIFLSFAQGAAARQVFRHFSNQGGRHGKVPGPSSAILSRRTQSFI
jgi:hypothetical protein